MNLYVFLQSIYQSCGFSLNFETTSQFQPNLEHSRHLKDIISLSLCRNWELNRIERFKLELSETEAKALGITGSAWQQLCVPGSHRPNLHICISHSPAQSALEMGGKVELVDQGGFRAPKALCRWSWLCCF